ncbi:MAG: hypothetical protein CM1200mP2_00860 [Planctomycetaceae bacterium]|nr:MAG: hypothetical protein CM1200mP2_00860 [Planctomycetaceae bacterium]
METKVFGSIVVSRMTWEPVRTKPSDIGSQNGAQGDWKRCNRGGKQTKDCVVSVAFGGGIDGLSWWPPAVVKLLTGRSPGEKGPRQESRRPGNFQRVAVAPKAALTGSAREIVDYTNSQIKQGWTDNEIKPSALASEPSGSVGFTWTSLGDSVLETVEAFLKDRDTTKRTKLIDNLPG